MPTIAMNESSQNKPTTTTTTTAAAAAKLVLARRNDQIPLSLGKASLRIRLEAYYSLISPETLSDRTVWLRKYDQIYEKVSNIILYIYIYIYSVYRVLYCTALYLFS